MIDASSFEARETLRNGASVKIRAVRPTDKAAVVEAFGKLEPESVYTRFFQAKGALSKRELKAATEVDFEKVVAMVVTAKVEGEEESSSAAAGTRCWMAAASRAPRLPSWLRRITEAWESQDAF